MERLASIVIAQVYGGNNHSALSRQSKQLLCKPALSLQEHSFLPARALPCGFRLPVGLVANASRVTLAGLDG